MSGKSRQPAPLYTDTFDLSQWCLGLFGSSGEVLPTALCRTTLELLESITLALKHRRMELHLDQADEALIRLRLQLRLANAAGLLEERQLLFALEQIDSIGRQLGGWIRSLEPI